MDKGLLSITPSNPPNTRPEGKPHINKITGKEIPIEWTIHWQNSIQGPYTRIDASNEIVREIMYGQNGNRRSPEEMRKKIDELNENRNEIIEILTGEPYNVSPEYLGRIPHLIVMEPITPESAIAIARNKLDVLSSAYL